MAAQPPPPQASMATPPAPAPAPPPSGRVIALLAALSNPSDHDRHTRALSARDDALFDSPSSHGDLVRNFSRVLALPSFSHLPPTEMEELNRLDPTSAMQLGHDPTGGWTYVRMMAGVLLKNALLRRGAQDHRRRVSGPAVSDEEVSRRMAAAGGGSTYPPQQDPQSQQMQQAQQGTPWTMPRPPPDALEEIKSTLLLCLVDPTPEIRKTVGSTIAACCSVPYGPNSDAVLPLEEWPEVIPYLVSCLSENVEGEHGGERVDGALDCLRKLCEDCPSRLDTDMLPNDVRPTSVLIPLFVRYMASPVESHRAAALESLNDFVESMPTALVINMEGYLGGLSALATDGSAKVRRLVCRGIVSLLSLRTEYLQPHFASIAQFMLVATSDADALVSLEACEFWLTFAALDDEVLTTDMVSAVRSLIPQLIPVLLKGMVYPKSKVEELIEENAVDESDAADRIQDVAPVFHRSRNPHGGKATGAAAMGGDHDVDDEGEEDATGGGDAAGTGEDGNEWSLRKCSAASLDILAGMYGAAEVLPTLLPALQEGLNHADPWVREASILALGAVAEGCGDAMQEHMPALHPFLVLQLSAALPQLRSISCWTLSRYSSWMLARVESGAQPELIRSMSEAFVQLALDRNRKVQVAACSGLGVLTEAFGELLVPYLEPIYRNLMSALRTYHTRSFMVLCDTLGIMADYVGAAIGEGQLPNIYVPPLVEMWMAHRDPLDTVLLPLMESLACIALALGPNFQPWALAVFDKCMATIENCMVTLATSANDPDVVVRDEDSDPIICASDLIDGMVEGLGSSFSQLVSSSAKYSDQFLSVLHALCQSDVPGVRMSAFALLGDLASRAPGVVEAGISELLREAISCAQDAQHPSVCNNAVWAIGEICVRCGKNATALSPFAADILAALIPLVMGNSADGRHSLVSIPGLAENAAATIGRLARVDPSFVKDDLSRFLSGWCEGLARIADFNERCEAFEGLLLAIHANPQAVVSSDNRAPTVAALIFAVVSWHIPANEDGVRSITQEVLHGSSYSFESFPNEASELGHALGQLLVEIKRALGPDWDNAAKMPPNVKRLLSEVYHI